MRWPWHVVSTDAAGVSRILFSSRLEACERYAQSYFEDQSEAGEVIAVYSTGMVETFSVQPVTEAN